MIYPLDRSYDTAILANGSPTLPASLLIDKTDGPDESLPILITERLHRGLCKRPEEVMRVVASVVNVNLLWQTAEVSSARTATNATCRTT